MWILLALTACHRRDTDSPAPRGDTAPSGPIPWSAELPTLADDIGPIRGYRPARTIVHLHSPWSHDACDGGEGAYDLDCLQDLRDGLCRTSVDAAFVTDHPAYAAYRTWEERFLFQDGDEAITADDGHTFASRIRCDDGHEVYWMPGVEDELMPVGMDAPVAEDDDEEDALLNGGDATSLHAEQDVGATVLTAHTEGRLLEDLEVLQDAGLTGTELFNLHAAFDPDIRVDAFGLDSFGWVSELAPFSSADGSAEPDLAMLLVLFAQQPSLERWDALLQRGPMVGTAGTDAHQNVLALELRDGERADSYRRMLRWFSNVLLVEGDDPAAFEQALRAGRSYVAFDVLGTPDGFDFTLEAGDRTYEMGSEAPEGTLVVGCPMLSPASPRGEAAPEITVEVLKDGQPWAEGCGEHSTDGPGVYRVEAHMVPWHLAESLGEDGAVYIQEYPWIYSNAIRVEMGEGERHSGA